MTHRGFLLVIIAVVAAAFVWSAVDPYDRFTWFLEVLPVIVGVIVLAATYRVFRWTDLVYGLIAVHAIILLVGGHYTYAEMPLFDWLRDTFHLSRNYYDRVGHFTQGFVPAIMTRELLLRTSPLHAGRWLVALVVAACLAMSAFYEFIEWWVALATGEAASAFLGTQGDVWDTQWDMFLAFIGAILALMTLSGVHNRGLNRLMISAASQKDLP
jgi:putative membrane protein